MIRVLHMIGSLNIGGSQAMVMNLYRNINREIIQFDFIIDHPLHTHLENEILAMGGRVYVMPSFYGWNYKIVKDEWMRFFEIHTEYKILHSHVRSYASIFLHIAKKKGIFTIIHSHSTSNGRGVNAFFKNCLQYPLRYISDYYFACSYEAGKWLFGEKVVKSSNFSVLKNAIDIKRYEFDLEVRNAIRGELQINDETFVLGYLGRVTEAKNPLFVIDVFIELRKMRENTKLLFVGNGNLLNLVKEYSMKLGISDDVIFTGARDDVERMYCAMDSYILPSNWEGLGISLIEAQTNGLVSFCSENIPEEARITELVNVIEINRGPKEWANFIAKVPVGTRSDCTKDIAFAGYDVEQNAQNLCEFYLNHVEY